MHSLAKTVSQIRYVYCSYSAMSLNCIVNFTLRVLNVLMMIVEIVIFAVLPAVFTARILFINYVL